MHEEDRATSFQPQCSLLGHQRSAFQSAEAAQSCCILEKGLEGGLAIAWLRKYSTNSFSRFAWPS